VKNLLKLLKCALLYVIDKIVLSANTSLYIIPPLSNTSLEVLPIEAF